MLRVNCNIIRIATYKYVYPIECLSVIGSRAGWTKSTSGLTWKGAHKPRHAHPRVRINKIPRCDAAVDSPAAATHPPRTPSHPTVRARVTLRTPSPVVASNQTRRKQTNNRRCTLFLDPQPPVADGLRAFVRSCPSHVAAMVDASPGVASNTDALTDKLAGVMAVNSLSAESMLARCVYFYLQLLFPSVWAIVLTSCFV